MRTHIRFISSAGFVVVASFAIAGASQAQSLQRPVDASPTPELSLGALAAQLNPALASSSGATRVYTNADLKMRPAPVAPVTPPFPEIAAPTGILEHWADDLEIEPNNPAPSPEQYGVPIWDGGFFPFSSSGPTFGGSRRQNKNYQHAPDPFTAFRRPNVVHFSGNGDFSHPATPSAGIRAGFGGMKPQHAGKPGSHSGQGGKGSGRGSRGK